jgi:hypothetical protein
MAGCPGTTTNTSTLNDLRAAARGLACFGVCAHSRASVEEQRAARDRLKCCRGLLELRQESLPEFPSKAARSAKNLGNVGFAQVKMNISALRDPAHIAMPCVHSGRLAVEAVAARDPPGRRFDPAARLLSGRLRFQVQSAHPQEPRAALLPADGAGRSDDAQACEGHHRRTALEAR